MSATGAEFKVSATITEARLKEYQDKEKAKKQKAEREAYAKQALQVAALLPTLVKLYQGEQDPSKIKVAPLTRLFATFETSLETLEGPTTVIFSAYAGATAFQATDGNVPLTAAAAGATAMATHQAFKTVRSVFSGQKDASLKEAAILAMVEADLPPTAKSVTYVSPSWRLAELSGMAREDWVNMKNDSIKTLGNIRHIADTYFPSVSGSTTHHGHMITPHEDYSEDRGNGFCYFTVKAHPLTQEEAGTRADKAFTQLKTVAGIKLNELDHQEPAEGDGGGAAGDQLAHPLPAIARERLATLQQHIADTRAALDQISAKQQEIQQANNELLDTAVLSALAVLDRIHKDCLHRMTIEIKAMSRRIKATDETQHLSENLTQCATHINNTYQALQNANHDILNKCDYFIGFDKLTQLKQTKAQLTGLTLQMATAKRRVSQGMRRDDIATIEELAVQLTDNPSIPPRASTDTEIESRARRIASFNLTMTEDPRLICVGVDYASVDGHAITTPMGIVDRITAGATTQRAADAMKPMLETVAVDVTAAAGNAIAAVATPVFEAIPIVGAIGKWLGQLTGTAVAHAITDITADKSIEKFQRAAEQYLRRSREYCLSGENSYSVAALEKNDAFLFQTGKLHQELDVKIGEFSDGYGEAAVYIMDSRTIENLSTYRPARARHLRTLRNQLQHDHGLEPVRAFNILCFNAVAHYMHTIEELHQPTDDLNECDRQRKVEKDALSAKLRYLKQSFVEAHPLCKHRIERQFSDLQRGLTDINEQYSREIGRIRIAGTPAAAAAGRAADQPQGHNQDQYINKFTILALTRTTDDIQFSTLPRQLVEALTNTEFFNDIDHETDLPDLKTAEDAVVNAANAIRQAQLALEQTTDTPAAAAKTGGSKQRKRKSKKLIPQERSQQIIANSVGNMPTLLAALKDAQQHTQTSKIGEMISRTLEQYGGDDAVLKFKIYKQIQPILAELIPLLKEQEAAKRRWFPRRHSGENPVRQHIDELISQMHSKLAAATHDFATDTSKIFRDAAAGVGGGGAAGENPAAARLKIAAPINAEEAALDEAAEIAQQLTLVPRIATRLTELGFCNVIAAGGQEDPTPLQQHMQRQIRTAKIKPRLNSKLEVLFNAIQRIIERTPTDHAHRLRLKKLDLMLGTVKQGMDEAKAIARAGYSRDQAQDLTEACVKRVFDNAVAEAGFHRNRFSFLTGDRRHKRLTVTARALLRELYAHANGRQLIADSLRGAEGLRLSDAAEADLAQVNPGADEPENAMTADDIYAVIHNCTSKHLVTCDDRSADFKDVVTGETKASYFSARETQLRNRGYILWHDLRRDRHLACSATSRARTVTCR